MLLNAAPAVPNEPELTSTGNPDRCDICAPFKCALVHLQQIERWVNAWEGSPHWPLDEVPE